MINKIIGNTPMIKIFYKYKGIEKYIYAKLEYYNLSGSIKDRVAYYILNDALKNGELKPGMPIVEATSGNTGISLAAIGAFMKCPVIIYMPDWVSEERGKILKMYGAEVHLISKEDGGFKCCIEEAQKYADEHDGFLANQFSNKLNIEAHEETTGKEIINKIIADGFISGIGTGGTLMGIGNALKDKNPNCHIWGLEPENMSLLKTGKVGIHKIDGIGDEFIPDIVDINKIENILLVKDEEAISMASMLSKKLGLGVGISSGANMIAAIKMHEEIDGDIVTVFPDDLKKYISSDLGNTTDEINCLEKDLELITYEII